MRSRDLAYDAAGTMLLALVWLYGALASRRVALLITALVLIKLAALVIYLALPPSRGPFLAEIP